MRRAVGVVVVLVAAGLIGFKLRERSEDNAPDPVIPIQNPGGDLPAGTIRISTRTG